MRPVPAPFITNPTATWICQRLREAFPYDRVPRYLIFDRDSKFSSEVVRTVRGMGVKMVRTAYRSPQQNGVAERWFNQPDEIFSTT